MRKLFAQFISSFAHSLTVSLHWSPTKWTMMMDQHGLFIRYVYYRNVQGRTVLLLPFLRNLPLYAPLFRSDASRFGTSCLFSISAFHVLHFLGEYGRAACFPFIDADRVVIRRSLLSQIWSPWLYSSTTAKLTVKLQFMQTLHTGCLHITQSVLVHLFLPFSSLQRMQFLLLL